LNTTVQNSKKGETAKEAWERVKPEIKIRLNKISKDLVAGNYKASFDEMPEKFLTYLAKKGSMSVNELKNITIKTMSKLTDNMKIIENTYDFENVKVGKTETGRKYAIIPTTALMKVNDRTVETKGKSIAFEDENQWYVINVDKDFKFFYQNTLLSI